MAVPPLVALQAAGKASKSLTGDILTRTTSKVVGKGKKAKVVEHTVHVNPLSVGIAGAVVAGGVLTLGAALWLAQLKLQPTKVETFKKVVDREAWTEFIPMDAVGHWSHETVKVGTQTQWIGDTFIRGVFKPGHWITTDKVQDTGKDIWVIDIPAYDKKVFHPQESHQESTGVKKSFVIEQRKAFSMSDVADSLNPLGSFGKKPIFGEWLKGDFLR